MALKSWKRFFSSSRRHTMFDCDWSSDVCSSDLIGLDDSTRENGCLHYVPGSHKWPDLPKPVLAGGLEESRGSLPKELQEKFKPVAVEMKKGEASFHHATG